MFKVIFELINDPLGLPINPIWEYVILLVLNEIAFQIAWNASPGGRWGSEIHWAVRLPMFIVLWAITYAIISAVKWICANWILVLFLIGGIAVVIGITAIILLNRKKRKTQCEK